MNEQQSKQRSEERKIMEAFVDALPDFAGEPLTSWDLSAPQCDPPDVTCLAASGRRVGIEIAQWMNEAEMKKVKSMELRATRIVEALTNLFKPDHGFTVYFLPSTAKLESTDYPAFREAFARVIDESTRSWDRLVDLRLSGQSSEHFLPLQKYLAKIVLRPIPPIDSAYWLLPFGRMGWYNDDTMWNPLRCLVGAKKKKCHTLKTFCDSLFLLIAYDQALGNCSPIQPRFQSVGEFIENIAQQFRADPGPFNGGFLLIPGDPVPTIHRLL